LISLQMHLLLSTSVVIAILVVVSFLIIVLVVVDVILVVITNVVVVPTCIIISIIPSIISPVAVSVVIVTSFLLASKSLASLRLYVVFFSSLLAFPLALRFSSSCCILLSFRLHIMTVVGLIGLSFSTSIVCHTIKQRIILLHSFCRDQASVTLFSGISTDCMSLT
jgi:hypothetical protein